MNRRYSAALISTTSALALSVSMAATVHAAQQEAQSAIEEVVVQARRVDENIQDVPVTILAVKEERLAELNIQTINTLQKLVPAFSTTAGTRGQYAWLRGLQ